MLTEQLSTAEPLEAVNHVFALRRSGHHAVIAWLTDSHEAAGHPARHINDAHLVHHRSDGAVARALTKEDVLRDAPRQDGAIIINYEDTAYDERHLSPVYRDLPGQDIVVVRDYANLMASRYGYLANVRKPHLGWRTSEDATRVWLEHAELLARSEQQQTSVVTISYNRWCTDAAYRNGLALRLGVTSAPLPKQVPKFGGGSSFDKQNMDGQAHNMNTLTRWRDLSPDIVEPYRKLLEAAGPTLREYNKRLFGIDLEEVISELQGADTAEASAAVRHNLR